MAVQQIQFRFFGSRIDESQERRIESRELINSGELLGQGSVDQDCIDLCVIEQCEEARSFINDADNANVALLAQQLFESAEQNRIGGADRDR